MTFTRSLKDTPRQGASHLIVIAPAWKSLPTKMPFMYSPYCSTTGRSSPRVVVIASSRCGVQRVSGQ